MHRQLYIIAISHECANYNLVNQRYYYLKIKLLDDEIKSTPIDFRYRFTSNIRQKLCVL